MTIEHRPPSASLSNTGAHRALRETREQLARVFDALHEGVVVQDRDGRIVAHNLAAERILGRSGDEIDGRTSYDPRWRAVHEDGSDFPGETHPALISLKTGLPVHNVVMGVHRADGSLVWINVNTAPFENDAGEPAGVVVGFTDVSERKYQEGQLKSALANLNSTLESTADGILVVGLDGAIIQFNRRFIEMWRIPQAVLDTRSDEQALAFVLDQLADPGAFVAKVEQLMQDVLAESFDLLRFKDGRVYERYSRPQILDSEPSGRVWSFRDVSERVRAEQSLQRSNTLFRTVQATSRVGGWEWDLASDFIYWTDETYRLFETTRDEYVPRVADIGRFFDSADDPTIRTLIRGTVISGQPFETEVKLRTAKGREIWVHTICSPTLEDGRTVRLTGAFQDVTERKQSERLQSALFAISNASHESSNLDDLYRRIHEIIGELMPARNFYIALLDADNDEISFPYWVDEVDPRPEPRRHSDGGGLTNWVIRHAEPLLLTPQASQDGSLPDGLRLIGTDSIDWLGVPLLVSGKAIGILAVQSYTGDVSYDQKHLELLQFVSGQIAVAVERKRAEEQLRDNEEKFRRVFDQSPSIIALLGYPGGEFVEVNDSGIQAFGFSREQIIGRSSVELNVWVNPDDPRSSRRWPMTPHPT